MRPIKKFLNLILILACMSYIAFFAYLNVDTIYINLPYIGEFRIPAAVAFLCTFVAGAIFSGFYFVIDTAKKSFEIKRSRKELSYLQRDTSLLGTSGNQGEHIKQNRPTGEESQPR